MDLSPSAAALIVPEQAGGRDPDAFEALVAAHKMAVARITRVEDQLIDLMRAHNGALAPHIAARYTAALDEARARAWATATALFLPSEALG